MDYYVNRLQGIAEKPKVFKKFNKLFVAKKTKVKIITLRGWWLVKKIESDREWIQIQGHYGLYHRGLIEKFTNL